MITFPGLTSTEVENCNVCRPAQLQSLRTFRTFSTFRTYRPPDPKIWSKLKILTLYTGNWPNFPCIYKKLSKKNYVWKPVQDHCAGKKS